jgi:hypothetical protein
MFVLIGVLDMNFALTDQEESTVVELIKQKISQIRTRSYPEGQKRANIAHLKTIMIKIENWCKSK